MPNTKWSELSAMQLGRYAEYYAKMEFTSYGFDVYTSEVDDHGVDFIAKSKDGIYFEVQVKSVRNDNYVFISKDKIVIDKRHLVCYIRFVEDYMPDEHESIFAKYYGTNKWNDSMFINRSDNVLVVEVYEDGSKKVGVAHTCDGEWRYDIPIIKRKIIYWMKMPSY